MTPRCSRSRAEEVSAEFGWEDAGRHAAFLQELLMSGLFIAMFVARGGGSRARP